MRWRASTAAIFKLREKIRRGLLQDSTISGEEVWLIKPQSYMNLSGGPVRAALDYYRLKPAGLLVAHDEIDLPPGTVRLKKGGGHGGHNGIRDVIQALRCGVPAIAPGRRPPRREGPGDRATC